MSWLSNFFGRKPPEPEPVVPAALSAPTLEPPSWAVDLLEAVQKSSRAQAKNSARVEALDGKLEGGFADLRSSLRERPASLASPAPALDPILDSLDLLDEACRTLASSDAEGVAEGLGGVTERLERFLVESGVTRIARATSPLDGRLFRVVGTVERTDLADGEPAQVVRAAALRGERVLREGEVLVNRRVAT